MVESGPRPRNEPRAIAARPTLRDVAAAAGVSITTASRALAHRGDVTASTRARVVDAAESVGYTRTWTERGRPSTRLLEVNLVLGYSGEWSDRVVQGAWRAAAQFGFDLSVRLDRPGRDEDWPRRVLRSQCAGVIFGLMQPLRSDLVEIHAMRVPVVIVGPIAEPEVAVHRVGTTDRDGGIIAGEHLIQRGATRFISVLGRPAYPFGRARDEGFRSAIQAHAPHTTVECVETSWTETDAIPELTTVLTNSSSVVGIFACNDAMALRCYKSVAAAGLKVGQDVLIVGFDDGPHAATANPPLTTLHQPLETMAARAVEIIAESASGDAESECPALPVRLVARGSTSGAPAWQRKLHA